MVTHNLFADNSNIGDIDIIKEDKNNLDELKLKNVSLGLANFTIGDEIILKDNPTSNKNLFIGIIQSVTRDEVLQNIVCYDKTILLKDVYINQIFTNMRPEQIIEFVVNTHTNLTFVSTITTNSIIETIPFQNSRATEVIDRMIEILEANYSVDLQDNFLLERAGQSRTNNNLVNNVNCFRNRPWTEDGTTIINEVSIEGRVVNFSTNQNFSGDTNQTEFILEDVPNNVRLEHPIGTELIGDVDGQVQNPAYRIVPDEKKIIFNTAPTSGTNNILVEYSFDLDVNLTGKNQSSIDIYGRKASVIKRDTFTSLGVVYNAVEYFINNYSNPLVSTQFNINNIELFENFKPNNLISITDTPGNRTGDFLIQRVMRTKTELKIDVISNIPPSPFLQTDIIDRIKQLERRDQNNTLIRRSETSRELINILVVTTAQIQQRAIPNNYLVFDSGDLWDGNSVWGDSERTYTDIN